MPPDYGGIIPLRPDFLQIDALVVDFVTKVKMMSNLSTWPDSGDEIVQGMGDFL